MTTRRALLLLAIIGMGACSPSHLQKDIAGTTDIGPVPTTISFPKPLWASFESTEIILETKVQTIDSNHNPMKFAEQAGLEINLVQSDGTTLALQFGAVNHYLSAFSTSLFNQHTKKGPFSAIRLRSKRAIRFERIIWLTCNNSETKDGTCFEFLQPGNDQ